MGLKSWWQKRQEEIAKSDIDAFLKKDLQDYRQSYIEYRKALVRRYFPRPGQDLLVQKAAFLDEYSVREREFRRDYMSWHEKSVIGAKCSRDIVEGARFLGQKKWREMVKLSQKTKTR